MSIADIKLLVKLIKLLIEDKDEFTWNFVFRTNENWQLSSSHVKLSDYFEDVNSPTDTELSLFALSNPSLTFIYCEIGKTGTHFCKLCTGGTNGLYRFKRKL